MASISQLIDRKNPLAVLEAFRRADDGVSRLVLMGQGPLHDRLVAESRVRGIVARVQLTGLIARENVYEHLSSADVFVSASRGEGLPVAVLEAMACRCPVVLSDIPPHREVAEGTDFIPLIAPDDVAGFAGEIRAVERAVDPRAGGDRGGMQARRRAPLQPACHAPGVRGGLRGSSPSAAAEPAAGDPLGEATDRSRHGVVPRRGKHLTADGACPLRRATAEPGRSSVRERPRGRGREPGAHGQPDAPYQAPSSVADRPM